MADQDAIAVVGIGCLFPQAVGPDALWSHIAVADPAFGPFPADRAMAAPPPVRKRLETWHGSFFESLQHDLHRYRIPPAYARSISRMTLMLMQVAEACVEDAGSPDRLPRDRVDVFCGTCFGFDSTLANALKIEGMRIAHELASSPERFEVSRDRLKERFGASSHDRVGEMASTIPARIAAHLKLRGRVQTIESADAGGYVALEAAVLALTSGQSDAVIVATGQRYETALTPLLLEQKGFSGVPLGEGAAALLLKRLPDARAAGDRIHSVIHGLAATRRDSADAFKYGDVEDTLRQAVAEACARAGIEPARQAYIDCVVPGSGQNAVGLRDALSKLGGPSPLPLRSSIATLGHGFANAALTAVAVVSLALARRTVPPLAQAWDEALVLPESVTAATSLPWPAERAAEGCVAGVAGVSLTGLCWHVVLAEPAVPASPSLFAEPAPMDRGDPIAVVGMGGAFGASGDSAAFWQALRDGADSVQALTEAVLPRAPYFSPDPKPFATYAQYGASLAQSDFDLTPYKLFPKRVEALDVAQKLALAVAAEALADFGLEEKRDRLGRALVVVASNLCLQRERQLACDLFGADLRAMLGRPLDPVDTNGRADMQITPSIDHLTLDGCLASGSAALISNCFGLRAVPMAVEAACASSLAALCHAVLGLRQHRYDIAVAGGVELPANARDLVLCASQMMLSRHKIAPFAEGADGFSPGDGAGMFVLKRLDDALRDGDAIHACITGIGGSTDANSMTAPDRDGQVLAMRRAFAQTSVTPATVQYVEAHGTGTKIGDRVEIEALAEVYGGPDRAAPLRIGSVKSNIGHAFAAAGSAGLLKTLLAMRHGLTPPTLVRRAVNPELPLAMIPAEIVITPQNWPAHDGVRRAAVNSMGTGGINYHLLLETLPPGTPPARA